MKTAAIILCLTLTGCAVTFKPDGSRTYSMDIETLGKLYAETP